MAVSKPKLPESLREEIEKQTETARKQLEDRTDGAREHLEGHTESARAELGERLFDLGEEYFPEVAQRRRRNVAAAAFVAGVSAGIAIGYAAGSMAKKAFGR